MPRAAQLAGQEFDRLTVERLATPEEHYDYLGRRCWRCRCQCGAIVYMTTTQLNSGRYGACPACGGPQPDRKFARTCVVCGVEFQGAPDGLVCSPDCRRARRRAVEAGTPEAGGLPPPMATCVVCGEPFHYLRDAKTCSPVCGQIALTAYRRRHFHKRVERDPELTRKMYRARQAKMARDPEYAEKVRLWWRKKHDQHRKRMKTDPEYAARHRKRHNAHYRANRDTIQAKRRARLLAMAPSELEAWMSRMRGYMRAYRRRFRAELAADPERHARFLDIQHEYRAQRFRLKATMEAARLETHLDERTDQP